MAVHFWPAFCVTSRLTSRMNRSHVSEPGSTSGPSTAAFRLSASTFTLTELSSTDAPLRSFRPVVAEPVKARTSWPLTWSSTSPADPAIRLRVPAGRMPPSTMISTMRAATSAVDVAGLVTTGMPARRATAAFSPKPHAGKLKALTCTATPRRGTRTWRPTYRGLRESCTASPSEKNFASPSFSPSLP